MGQLARVFEGKVEELFLRRLVEVAFGRIYRLHRSDLACCSCIAIEVNRLD